MLAKPTEDGKPAVICQLTMPPSCLAQSQLQLRERELLAVTGWKGYKSLLPPVRWSEPLTRFCSISKCYLSCYLKDSRTWVKGILITAQTLTSPPFPHLLRQPLSLGNHCCSPFLKFCHFKTIMKMESYGM